MAKWESHNANRNVDWQILRNDDGTYNNEQVQKALLMDIRKELVLLNHVMQCPNVGVGFRALAEMNRRTKAEFNLRVKRAVARQLKKRN